MCVAALSVALLAAFVSAAGQEPPLGQPVRARRVHRDATARVETPKEPGGPVSSAAPGGVENPSELGALGELGELDDLGELGAWRSLWAGALDALRREPSFGNTSEVVQAQLGAAAFLHCAARHVGERGVSWVRRRDWHIISSGALLYTNDERFQVLHAEGTDDWVLQIKYVQSRDNGTYECQVSTARGTLSRLVHLLVAVPEAFILGAEEHHVDEGSAINLVCIIEKSPVPPQFVFWFHEARMVNYEAGGGVSVRTVRGPKTQSALSVRAARPHHAGNYTCAAANTRPAHILVYVSAGSDSAAATLSRSQAPPPPHTAPPAPLAALALLALLSC